MAICPVCGYPELEDNYKFEYCPSCRFQFNVTDQDKGFTYEQWREKWIKEGMNWGGGHSKPPEGWDPKKQLKNLSRNVSD